MTKRIILAVLAVCSAALCACSAPLEVNVEELLQPPQLSSEQTAVYDTLRDYVGQTIKLKYPATGEYRSAFTFHDLDGDGADEAIVLYTVPDSASAWISILAGAGSSWQVRNLMPGAGGDIDFLRFGSLFTGENENIIVGWGLESTDKKLAVYRYANGGIESLFEGAYSTYAMADFNLDVRDEIILISSTRTRPSVKLVAAEGDAVSVRSAVYLNSSIASVRQPIAGEISAAITGIVMDCRVDGGALCTAAVQVAGFKLKVLLGGDGDDLSATLRVGAVHAEDINGDGVIEIPAQALAPGHEDSDDDTRMYFTNYCRYNAEAENKLEIVQTAFVNTDAGYRMSFPAEWDSGQISVVRQKETGEVTFFVYTGDLYDHSRELLRLRINQSQDYQDKFDTQKYLLLASRGSFEYYGCLTAQTGEPLAITLTQLKSLFGLIG